MISELLKTQTKKLHDEVEKKLDSQKIFSEVYTLQDYHLLLLRHYYLLSSAEESIFSTLNSIKDLASEKRRKLPVLEQDLRNLGVEIPIVHHHVEFKNSTEALGFLYVIEGSGLGNNMIKKHLKKNPNFAHVEFLYLDFYGEQLGSHWKNFLQILNREISEDQKEDCIAGAEKAYSFLLNLSLQ